jgi:hypothetical protein
LYKGKGLLPWRSFPPLLSLISFPLAGRAGSLSENFAVMGGGGGREGKDTRCVFFVVVGNVAAGLAACEDNKRPRKAGDDSSE